jgi:phage shock protein PspC (stress-responsive transcriptional regulator)
MTDPAYRSATFLGCMMMAFQQLSGINVIILYSSKIFESVGISTTLGAALTNSANLFGAIVGMSLLSCFGRKFSLCLWTLFMAGCMIGMGFAFNISAATPELIFILAFVFFFELGNGVIPWLYAAEILSNSGMSAAVVTANVFTLLISSLA